MFYPNALVVVETLWRARYTMEINNERIVKNLSNYRAASAVSTCHWAMGTGRVVQRTDRAHRLHEQVDRSDPGVKLIVYRIPTFAPGQQPMITPTALPIPLLQEQVDRWITEHGVRYFNELTNMAMLTEEVGEVARIIARRYGEQSEKESDKNKALGAELADVLFVVLCLANQTNTDLQQAWDQRMEDKAQRDQYRHTTNPKLR